MTRRETIAIALGCLCGYAAKVLLPNIELENKPLEDAIDPEIQVCPARFYIDGSDSVGYQNVLLYAVQFKTLKQEEKTLFYIRDDLNNYKLGTLQDLIKHLQEK